jgi:hypothetical protein
MSLEVFLVLVRRPSVWLWYLAVKTSVCLL